MPTDRAIPNGSQGSSFADPQQTSTRKPEPPTALVLCGEYDAANAQALRDELARAIDADETDLVLHLGDVTFLNASTLTVFIEAKTLLDREGRFFSLGTLSPAAARIIEICGLQCLLEGRTGTTQARCRCWVWPRSRRDVR